MNKLIESVERRQSRKLPAFREGDRVRVHFQVIEGTRTRTQVFEGVVLKLQGPGIRRTFSVRKMSFGVGVERTFPLHSPKIEQVEVVARGEVRRAKLYYLRGRIGRAARVRERRNLTPEELAAMAPLAEPDAELTEDGAEAEVAGDEIAAGAEGAEPSAENAESSAEPDAEGAEPAKDAESGAEPSAESAEGAESGAESAESGAQDAEAKSGGDGDADGEGAEQASADAEKASDESQG